MAGAAADRRIPDVLALQELDGSLQALRKFRRWMAARGYAVAGLPGEGATNGVAIAWRESTISARGGALAIADRALAARLTRLADGAEFGAVALHGKHGNDEGCCAQLGETRRWLGGQAGGLLLGDINRVLCKLWRSGEHKLGKADAMLRAWQGAGGCVCCGAKATDDAADAELDCAEVVEDAKKRGRHCQHFTRAEVRRGQEPRWTARLDQIWATGAEMGGWSLDGLVKAVVDGGEGRFQRLISDHAWVEATRTVHHVHREARPTRRGTGGVASAEAVSRQFEGTDCAVTASMLQREGRWAESVSALTTAVVEAHKAARLRE